MYIRVSYIHSIAICLILIVNKGIFDSGTEADSINLATPDTAAILANILPLSSCLYPDSCRGNSSSVFIVVPAYEKVPL
jgi:hypothetical protein